MKKTIFVGGIHGVGKTSLCRALSDDYKLPHYSASRLISELKNEQFASDKKIEKIEENQDFLSIALNKLQISDNHIILDGHFCLLNKFAEVTKIPENIYENINPIGIIIVTDSIEKIFERLAERDGIKYDLKLLEAFQSEELEYSEQIAKRSNIPYFVHQTENNEGEMRNFLEKLLE